MLFMRIPIRICKTNLFLLYSFTSFYRFSFVGSLSFSTAEEPILGFGMVDAFPGIEFKQPVVITSPPGATNSLFIVERLGKVYAVTNLAKPTKTLFLDLTGSHHFGRWL